MRFVLIADITLTPCYFISRAFSREPALLRRVILSAYCLLAPFISAMIFSCRSLPFESSMPPMDLRRRWPPRRHFCCFTPFSCRRCFQRCAVAIRQRCHDERVDLRAIYAPPLFRRRTRPMPRHIDERYFRRAPRRRYAASPCRHATPMRATITRRQPFAFYYVMPYSDITMRAIC